jgi:hypothetical protein
MNNCVRTLAIIAALAAPSIALAQVCPPGQIAQGGTCVLAPSAGSTTGTVAAQTPPPTPAPGPAVTNAPGGTSKPAASTTASATTPPAPAGSTTAPATASTATPQAVSGSSTPPAQENKTCSTGMTLYNGMCYPVH